MEAMFSPRRYWFHLVCPAGQFHQAYKNPNPAMLLQEDLCIVQNWCLNTKHFSKCLVLNFTRWNTMPFINSTLSDKGFLEMVSSIKDLGNWSFLYFIKRWPKQLLNLLLLNNPTYLLFILLWSSTLVVWNPFLSSQITGCKSLCGSFNPE